MARDKYHPVSIVLHWAMALIVVGTSSLGFLGANFFSKKSWIGTLFLVHKTMGLTILALAIVRLLVRISYEMNPAKITDWERRLSRAGHILMYILFFTVPLSGYSLSNANGHNVHFFNLTLPTIVNTNKALGELFETAHMIMAYTLFVVFLLHVIMAVKHLLVDRVNLFERIL